MTNAYTPVPAEKRQAVLEAATTIFLSHGFSAATTDMIQRQARVSKTTLYACFPNKEAMFTAVIEDQCARMAASIRALEATPGDIAATLTELGTSYLRLVLSREGIALYRVALAEAPRFPELSRQFFLAGPKVITTMVGERLEQAARAGQIDIHSIGTPAAAAQFMSLLRGEIHLDCLVHPAAIPSPTVIEDSAQQAVGTFLRAFGT